MSDKNELIQTMAAEAFNLCWDYMDRKERSREDDAAMLAAALSQYYLWDKAGTDVNRARGEWQVSRVYTLLKKAEEALFHADRCLEFTLKAGLSDFDLVYAYEAMARASLLNGDEPGYSKYYAMGEEALKGVKEEEDRNFCRTELLSIRN